MMEEELSSISIKCRNDFKLTVLRTLAKEKWQNRTQNDQKKVKRGKHTNEMMLPMGEKQRHLEENSL